MILTKSMFLDWLNCPGYCWLLINDPDQAAAIKPAAESGWAPIGSEIETLAQQLFPKETWCRDEAKQPSTRLINTCAKTARSSSRQQ